MTAPQPSSLKNRCFRRKWLLVAACFIFLVTSAVVLHITRRGPPSTQIILVSLPVPSAQPMVHYQPNSKYGSYTYITQDCHIAEVQLKNLGPGSIVLPYRGGISVEIQESGSTNWIDVTEGRLGIVYQPTHAGKSQSHKVRIPDTASHWRASTEYYRWSFPQQLLNYVLREWLHLELQIGGRKMYSVQSEVWQHPSSAITNQQSSIRD